MADEWDAIPDAKPAAADPWDAIPDAKIVPQLGDKKGDEWDRIPDAFNERVARAEAMDRAFGKAFGSFSAFGKGFGEGFGDQPLGELSPKTIQEMKDLGIVSDPTIGRTGVVHPSFEALANIIKGVAVANDAFQRTIAGGVHGLAAAGGYFAQQVGIDSSEAEREIGGYLEYELQRGDRDLSRVHKDGTTQQTIGPLPKPEDFKTAAKVLDSPAAEKNLRDMWEEKGLHPAEVVHDAQSDAFLKGQVQQPWTNPGYEHMTPTKLPPVQNSPMPDGTPRSELAKTGEPHIDQVLDSPVTRRVIDNPVVDREHTVPYTAGGSVPLEDPTVFIDHRFPTSFEIDGVRFDPADPFVVHENVEQHVMEDLTRGGMKPEEAYRVAHFEYAEKAEGAWYRAHGIDQAKAEAAYAPFMAQIQHEGTPNTPSNLYTRPYPHDTPSAAMHEAIAEPKPTAEEIARAKAILTGDKGELTGASDRNMQRAAWSPAMEAIDDLKESVSKHLDKIASGDTPAKRLNWLTQRLRNVAKNRDLEKRMAMGELSPADQAVSDALKSSDAVKQAIETKDPQAISQAVEQLKSNLGNVFAETDKIYQPHSLGAAAVDPTEQRIRQAFFDIAGSPPMDQVRLNDLRERLSDLPRALIDQTLLGMHAARRARLSNLDNPRDIKKVGDAALPMPNGMGNYHTIWINDELGAGADVTRPENLPPDAPPSVQPTQSAARLVTAAQNGLNKMFDISRDIQMKVAPMATGTRDSMAIAKDFANTMRRNRWEWSRIDTDIERRFTPEQRKRMWDAADEESVARQLGESREHQGLVTLEPDERAAVEELQTRAQAAWLKARDLGMVEGEGLPAYTPRMVINTASALDVDRTIPLNGIGLNLRTRTAQMMRRKYMTAEETEAAAKAKLGEGAEIARDIRALPLATAKLEDAIAGRTLIDRIKEYGRDTGSETVTEGGAPSGSEYGWFTLDHPAFKRWEPALKDGEAVKDADGNTIFKQVPLYVRSDFEGPLRSVLTQRTGAAYGALMSLKGKTMGLIMNSPLIHNAVEWGRALPAMPGKVATFKVYFEGNRVKNDPVQMREAIDAGLVPIGKRFFNQDINAIMEAPDLTPGRSFTAKVLGFVPGLFDAGAETAVRRAIDKAGDFWHNTMLWDRVADLQMGLYSNFRDGLIAKGVDRQTSARAAAHWANRYAGALPQEAMSDAARKISNMLMFSRSFTLGNWGVMKDMLTGLPKDVWAQIERDGGFPRGSIEAAGEEGAGAAEVRQFTKGMARRKAAAIIALDMGLMYVMNSVLQSASNVLRGDNTLDQEMRGYAERLSAKLQSTREHPLELLQPFKFIEDISATSQNEPDKGARVKVGHTKDGTAIYARIPPGKIGEEFEGYPTGPFDMIKRKLGTIARPAWQILNNDAGFGRKIYDPNADTIPGYLANIGKVVTHLAGSQLPENQISGLVDLVKGDGDAKVNALQAFGPIAGITFAKGAPGGEAVGEMYHAKAMHEYKVDAALPDIRKQIQRGDIAGAQQRMQELGIAPGLQKFYIRTSLNPSTRLGGRTLRDFYQYATPEQRARMERARQ